MPPPLRALPSHMPLAPPAAGRAKQQPADHKRHHQQVIVPLYRAFKQQERIPCHKQGRRQPFSLSLLIQQIIDNQPADQRARDRQKLIGQQVHQQRPARHQIEDV